MNLAQPAYLSSGKSTGKIDVRISYEVIKLFSEGLYSSPHKAVEELVSNAFDAGAQNVQVILSPSLLEAHSTIVVIDDGIGMDAEGLRKHWIIGVSDKRKPGYHPPNGRSQIGKFGIGKLATYVLATRLTHLTKSNGKFYATSMDYSTVPAGGGGGIYTEKLHKLNLRELTEQEAKTVLTPWIDGEKEGYKALKLFGKEASASFTVAILSELKDMAIDIKLGRLNWILQTAMPLRDDFKLFLNGDRVSPAKLKSKKIGRWVLGKDLKNLPSPAPDDMTPISDPSLPPEKQFGLSHPKLGSIHGYVELYEELLTTGKSSHLDRSHGFFVYVRDRLVNLDDEYFGIDKNILRHGTFARFRMVVYIDALDLELRSSRETVREGVLFNLARNLLHSTFNFTRSKHQEFEEQQDPSIQLAKRFRDAPASLTRRPLLALAQAAMESKASPKLTVVPSNLSASDRSEFLEELQARADDSSGTELIKKSELTDLLPDQGIAVFDVQSGVLRINIRHPFVAYFLDEYEDRKRNLPLELLAMSEVLIEAHLYELGVDEATIRDFMSDRDEVLRNVARSTGRRNAYMIARDFQDAANDEKKLELELVAVFTCMGFEAIPLGGSDRPDGRADAHLAGKDGTPHRYAVSLEAKSKEKEGKTVSNQSVRISTIARHRDEQGCDHALVVGPDFQTQKGDDAAVIKEAKADRENTNRTITLARIHDIARLVRLVPLKHARLDRLKEMFEQCITPDETAAWIDKFAKESPPKLYWKEILETIHAEQKEEPNEVVEYGSLQRALARITSIPRLSKAEVIEACKALASMAPGLVAARDNSVELTQRPDRVLEAINSTVKQYPSNEQKLKL